jgi:hypothetical protein
MNGRGAVHCNVYGLRAAFTPQCITFDTESDLTVHVDGDLGPRGLSEQAADLIDLGAAVYQIERLLRGRQRTNPPVRFDLFIELRRPEAWPAEARSALARLLAVLGNATWNVYLGEPSGLPVTAHGLGDPAGIDRVTLLSGGLDSASGAAADQADAANTRLVSFYTRQKTLQQDISARLGYQPPAQWRMSWEPASGRGHTFRYRSFFFLCLAVAVADSWTARRVLQYENGVLATAVPPTPAWLIKRECVEAGRRAVGAPVMDEVAKRTETCWFHWSNRVVGGRKTPGVPCGVCIPCLVRRTALQDNGYGWDLRQDEVRNDPALGLAFRAYYGFLEDVRQCRSAGSFYRVLPPAGRELVAHGTVSLQDMYDLFQRFADEFRGTFGL